MNIKELKFIKKTYLAEIFQSMDIKFSFVDKNMQQVSSPAKCRDFLGDCLWSRVWKKPVSIYSFVYNFETHPYDEDVLRLSLTFPDISSYDNFISNLPILHEKEKEAGTTLSAVYKTQEELTLLIESDKLWQSSVWKLSLFTFYLKLISYKDVSCLSDPEDRYMEHLTEDKEKKLLSKIKEEFSFYYDGLSMNHNYAGFVSTLKMQNEYGKLIFGGV